MFLDERFFFVVKDDVGEDMGMFYIYIYDFIDFLVF